MADDRRLIEDYLPIQEISVEASRETSVRKGRISALHQWWARRPLVACRAAVYGALVSSSQFASENFSDEQLNRNSRHKKAQTFISELCKYPGDNQVINEAQKHILKNHAEKLSAELKEKITVEDILAGHAPRPKVLDMFAGGGSIPLEALRLGCDAYAIDLNPVAHIMELCTLVYPQKYGKPNTFVKGMAGTRNANGETTWGGLAEEVRYWGNWILERVRKEIGDFYLPIPDPEAKREDLLPKQQLNLFEDAEAQPSLKISNGYLMPVAYLWTRTVKCKNPLCGADVPLVKQTWLCKKDKRYVALQVIAQKGAKKVQFKVVETTNEKELSFDPTAFSKGGNAACFFCGTVTDSSYVKEEGCAGRLGQQMMAVACTRPSSRGKVYISANELEEYIPNEQVIQKNIQKLVAQTGLTIPNEPIINDAKNANFCILYGLSTFGDLFTSRQKLCLLTFASIIKEATKNFAEFKYENDEDKALSTCLAIILDRLSDFNSMGCTWNYTGGRGVLHTMARQAIPIVWDFAETNPFNPDGASWVSAIEDVPTVFDELSKIQSVANVIRASATQIPLETNTIDAVITDPPYYDNIPYANISDFFYVWLKRTIGTLYPEHFSTLGTPKKNEAVADAMRHEGNKQKAKQAYENMMAEAFSEAHRVLKSNGQMVIVYAHKTTLGWATLVDALRKAGFTVTEAWPLDTERAGRLRAMDSAALASSIFLVARKRGVDKTGSYEDEVRPELEQIVRERVETLWEMGITGADLIIAAVGAGLRAFTRFVKVEYLNGDEVPAERFLSEVEGVVLETLLKKIFEDISKQENTEETESEPATNQDYSGVSNVDPQTRFYILWRYTYGRAEIDAGEAIVFAYPQDVELEGHHGIAQGARALAEKKKSKYRLRDFTERGERTDLGLPDSTNNQKNAPTLIDVLHRVLWLVENEPAKIGEYLQEAKPDKEKLRLVAQALAGPGLRGGEADAKLINTTPAETSALGKLLANWRQLIDTYLEDFRLRG